MAATPLPSRLTSFSPLRRVRLQADRVRLKPDTTYYDVEKSVRSVRLEADRDRTAKAGRNVVARTASIAAVTAWALVGPSCFLEAQSPSVVLSLSCRLSARSAIPSFQFTLTNGGSTDLAVTVGTIWRGEHLPNDFGLTVIWPETHAVDEFEWSPPRTQVVVEGPVDPWILPLRAGASYTLLLGGTDFVDVYRAVPLRLNVFSAPAEVVAHLGTTSSTKISVPGDCSEISGPR